MAEPTPQKIRQAIEDFVQRFRPQELRVEINAHQKAYALDSDLQQWLASYGCRLNAHFTGKNKWDTNFGVAGMSTLFGTVNNGRHQKNNLLEIPSTENSEGLKALIQQLLTWKPETRSKTDCVMALWFAVIRCREFMQQNSSVQRYAHNRWATRAQVARRYSVNLDDAIAEQWQEMFG